ncbi:tyrosine-type recombinase/integrase [Pseudomonas otitidis]|uniref:phage integrase n=1 Tax=Metapseudomonas otitidis TaxID=319939 RepID=UPI0013F6563B|nr:tyrosine-type recombinase/integrase [Pseudomonas otitidis]MDH1105940.1 tyrosine-type recombinase/integrase [Pseudomonas otitidis]MDH1157918.1 tyrosine-type recombinase/integrase [Pseudomonas otitidis]MDH1166576.1 tyrosine-type recombinase/integrase [Pseudomonas otitidis]
MISKGSNGWDVDFWLDKAAGIRKRKRGFRTKSEAERWVSDLRREYRHRGRDPGERLSDLVDTWYELHGSTLKDPFRYPRTKAIALALGNPIAKNFTALDFGRYRTERLKTCTPATVNHEHRYLKAVFNELIRLGVWHEPNPIGAIRQLRVEETERSYLTLDQCRLLLKECEASTNSHTLPVAKLCLATGARWDEAESLARTEVRDGQVRFVRTKNGKGRSVPIPPELEQLILERGYPGSGRLFSPCRGAFRKAYERTGLHTPGQLTHILRHTFASHYMMQGGNILTLQRILGHGDIKMTMRYSHLAPDHFANVLTHSPLSLLGQERDT